MLKVLDSRTLTATLIFDLEDQFVRERRTGATHPRPIGPVSLFMLGSMQAGTRQLFARPLELVTQRSPSGYLLFLGCLLDKAGNPRNVVLAPGTYIVRVEAERYQPVERDDIVMPRSDAAYFFDLPPGLNYPFPPGG
jgi:hypothetical protein